MDVNPLRTWGIAVSAACMAGALAIALTPARPHAAVPAIAPSLAPQPEGVSFTVRFSGNGPIARAQALAARGRESAAARRIRAQLTRQQAFAGLCFQDFLAGAIELRSCALVAANERSAYQQDWLRRLQAMPAVAEARAN